MNIIKIRWLALFLYFARVSAVPAAQAAEFVSSVLFVIWQLLIFPFRNTAGPRNTKAHSPSPTLKVIEENGLPVAVAMSESPKSNVKTIRPSKIIKKIGIISTTTSIIPKLVNPSPSPLNRETPIEGATSDLPDASTSIAGDNSLKEAENSESYDTNSDSLIKAHGALMFLAWCVLAPAGIIAARYYKPTAHGSKRWFPLHVLLFGSSFVATAISFALVYVATGEDHFSFSENGIHVVLGLAIVVLMGAQLVSGPIINRLFSASRTKVPWWDRVHHWSGRLLFVAAVINIPLGISLYVKDLPSDWEMSPWVWISYQGWLLLLVGVLAFLEGLKQSAFSSNVAQTHREQPDGPAAERRNDFQSLERGMSDSTLLEFGHIPLAKEKAIIGQTQETVAPSADYTRQLAATNKNLPSASPVRMFGVGLNQSRVLTPPGTLSRNVLGNNDSQGLDHMETRVAKLHPETSIDSGQSGDVVAIRYLGVPPPNPETMQTILNEHSVSYHTQCNEIDISQKGSVIAEERGKGSRKSNAKASLMELYQGYETFMREQKGQSWAGFPSAKIAEAAESEKGVITGMANIGETFVPTHTTARVVEGVEASNNSSSRETGSSSVDVDGMAGRESPEGFESLIEKYNPKK
ncbi:hypothetical protein BDR26DRAFT_936295 [Obelidium mucronatum]|nr:hypothetical protein BDR26DRAFT_936295 [Obelidium mucronatum]